MKNLTGHYFCGGAILNNKWIITVKQCIEVNDDIIIQAGSRFLESEESESNIQSIKVKRKVVLDNKYSAPALLELEKPLKFNPLTQNIDISSFKNAAEDKDVVITSGWGPNVLNHFGQSNILRVANKTANDCGYAKTFCVIEGDGNACIVSTFYKLCLLYAYKKILLNF